VRTSNAANTAKPRVAQSLRMIEQPGEREYPPHANLYIDLLPDDGLILAFIPEENLKSNREVIASMPKAPRCFAGIPKENERSRPQAPILWRPGTARTLPMIACTASRPLTFSASATATRL
jgi:hypothetical protein